MGAVMSMVRAAFVVAGIVGGSTAIGHFVLGDTVNFSLTGSRVGFLRDAKARTACYFALEFPEKDRARPTLPPGQNRIAPQDYNRMVEMTAALNCYVATQRNAICEPNNRAYIVD